MIQLVKILVSFCYLLVLGESRLSEPFDLSFTLELYKDKGITCLWSTGKYQVSLSLEAACLPHLLYSASVVNEPSSYRIGPILLR